MSIYASIPTTAPAERCGDLKPRFLSGERRTECVLRPGHNGSHADEHGARWRMLPGAPDDGQRAVAGWAPPPPGDTREQLPDHLLALIDPPDYLSTACGTADCLTAAISEHPEHADELSMWLHRMHTRCRLNMKFTGQLCCCPCHTATEEES